MGYVIRHIDLVVCGREELDIEETEMVVLMALVANVHLKLW